MTDMQLQLSILLLKARTGTRAISVTQNVIVVNGLSTMSVIGLQSLAMTMRACHRSFLVCYDVPYELS